MGNIGTKFCQGCNNICGDGKSMGESNLTNNNNPPITSIYNPFLNNNQASNLIPDPKINNENNESTLNNINKVDSYLTSVNSHLPAEEEQKKTQLYSKNSNNNNNNLDNINNNLDNINNNLDNVNNNVDNINNNINYYNNNYNNNFNNNSLNNSNEFSMKGKNNENTEDISARKITKLFRKFLEAKKLSHQQIIKENSNIPTSEYTIGLNMDKLNINLAPEENCIYLGNKFGDKKDGLGLELFNNSNAVYFGRFRNGKRIELGKFTISNQINEYTYGGEVQGIYARGFGLFYDKKKFRDYEGFWDNSMKSGYGIEKYKDNSEYKGCFKEGKKEGIGTQKWDDGSFYEGEWKNNKFHGFGIYQFVDGSEYRGHWKKGKFDGFGEFVNPDIKKYFGFFKNDNRSGFGFELVLKEKRAFIGFFKNNEMNGYGKLIQKDKKIYGLWKKGQLSEKIKKKDFFKKLGDEKNGFFNFFRLDNYNDVLKNVNAEEDDE